MKNRVAASQLEVATPADRRRPWLMAGAHIVLIWAMALGVMWQSYQDVIGSWKVTADNINQTVAAHARQTQTAAELVLTGMADWVAAQHIETEEEFRRVAGQRVFYDVMRDRISGQPQIGVVLAVARNGDELLTTRAFPAPPTDLAEREPFQALMESDEATTILTATRKDGVDGNYRFFMTRKIRSPSGQVLGAMAVGLEARFYADFYRRIAVDPDNTWISLFRADGTLLATSLRDQTLLGKRFEQAATYKLLQAGRTGEPVLVTLPPVVNSNGSSTRIADVRIVEGFPLVVSVIVGERTYLDHWWSRNFLVIGIGLMLTGLTVLAAIRALRLIKDAEAAYLAASERQILQAVVETPSALTAVIDRDGKVVHSNQRFRELMRCESEPREALFDPALQGADALLAFVRGGTERTGELDLAVGQPGDRVSLLHFSLSRQSLPDTGDCVIAVGHDETMRRQAERAIAMSGKLVTLGEMSSGIAHELSQPLNVIRMAAQNALVEASPEKAIVGSGEAEDDLAIKPMSDDEFRDFAASKLRRIIDQVDRAAAIIARMRIFSRTSREGPAPFDVRKACDGAAMVASQGFRRAGIALHKDLGEEPVLALGNIHVFEQVLANLLTNAREAVGDGRSPGGEVKIAVRRGTGDRILVSVSDSGPGVPAEIRDRVFEPFFTTKPVGDGTGLGLAMAYGLVSDMGGTLLVLPDGPGATFQIDLPGDAANQ